MAQNVFANNSATYTYTDENGETQTGTRKRIVILFTDGETDSQVSTVLSYSNTLKSTYDATVYCVGFGSSVNSNFLSYVSSNYGSDTSYRGNSYSGTSSGTTKYSMTATNATELNNIFQTITEDVSSDSTTVTLNSESVMKDIMGEGFTLTSNSTVSIKTVAGSSNGTDITWGTETTNPEGVTATISDDKTTVSVTSFDYATNYISSGHEGAKLCVTITNVLPTADVTTDEAVYTNSADSGIYATSDATEATATFNQPQTIITKKAYVLDYAKTSTLSNLDQSSVTGIVSAFQSVSSDDDSLTQSYGTSALSGSTLTYTPTTMQWSGYDSLYVFDQTTNEKVLTYTTNTNARDDNTANLWSKVSVIPANNVYYEDDFVSVKDSEGNITNGVVGIVYTGTWDTSNVDNSSGTNTETANGGTYGYGWESQLADDTGDSDGSSHVSSTFGATATFTFTGTGVDIYGRTNMNSGKIYVRLVDNSGNTKAQSLLVDELSVYGEDDFNYTYYQIPTASFSDLDYGSYTVTITVMLGDDANGTYTYYLDGIRVYNPLGTVTEDDGDAYEAYAEDNELNAVFTEVRDMLISAESFTADDEIEDGGVVFIDDNVYNGEGETANTTSVIGTYVDLGPKNEVYLAAGQSIAFKVNTDFEHFYLGLKAPFGSGTTATVTNGSGTSNLTINHTTDLYYEITPTSGGYVIVKNTGSSLLSITKLRGTSTTAVDTSGDVEGEDTNAIATLSTNEVAEIMLYAASFDSLTSVAYSEAGVEAEDIEADETESDDSYVDLTEDDIEIDNPTEETEAEETESEAEETEATSGSSQQSHFSSLLNSIVSWFNGRR